MTTSFHMRSCIGTVTQSNVPCEPITIHGFDLVIHRPPSYMRSGLSNTDWQISEPRSGVRVGLISGTREGAIQHATDTIIALGVERVNTIIEGKLDLIRIVEAT